MLNVHTVYMTLSSHSDWISRVSAVISLRLQLNFIILNKRDAEHFIPGEGQQCFWPRGGGWLWVTMWNCIHMGCVVSFVLCRGDSTPLYSHNPLFEPLSSLPCVLPIFFLSHYPLHPPSQLPTSAFPHLFTVLSSSSMVFPLFSPPVLLSPVLFLSLRRLSICFINAIRWMDYRN